MRWYKEGGNIGFICTSKTDAFEELTLSTFKILELGTYY